MGRPGHRDDLIGAIYEAALAPELWPVTLSRIAVMLGADNGNLFVHDLLNPRLDFFATSSLDPAAGVAYGDYFIKTDTWNPVLARLPAGRAHLSHTFMEDREFERTEFHADFLKSLDIFYGCGGFAVRQGSRAVQAGFQRSRRAGPFGTQHADQLNRLYGHLGRAVAIHDRLTLERMRANASAAALDRMPFGVILMTAARRVTAANRTAIRMIEAGEFQVLAGHLDVADDLDGRRLAAAVRAATSPTMPHSQTLALSRSDGRPPLIVAVLPVTDRLLLATGAADATVCLLIGDSARRRAEARSMLRQLFGLTPAEARLAAALTNGLSLGEIATVHGVTRETVRGQLKTVFQKTGTGRQQDLLRLVLAIPSVD